MLVSRVSSAARRIDPSPPITSASSQPSPGVVAATSSRPGPRPAWSGSSPRSFASSASSRTAMPCSVSGRDAVTRDLARLGSAGVGEHAAPGAPGCRVGHGSTLSPAAPQRGRYARPRRARRPRRSRAGTAAQQQEELDVARRPRQRADRDGDRAPSARGGQVGDVGDGLGPQARSRTTPPLPTRSLPTSNCGLTIRASSPSSPSPTAAGPGRAPSEMKDRSPTTRSTGSPTSSGVSSRMLVRSWTITRSSLWSDHASWP